MIHIANLEAKWFECTTIDWSRSHTVVFGNSTAAGACPSGLSLTIKAAAITVLSVSIITGQLESSTVTTNLRTLGVR